MARKHLSWGLPISLVLALTTAMRTVPSMPPVGSQAVVHAIAAGTAAIAGTVGSASLSGTAGKTGAAGTAETAGTAGTAKAAGTARTARTAATTAATETAMATATAATAATASAAATTAAAATAGTAWVDSQLSLLPEPSPAAPPRNAKAVAPATINVAQERDIGEIVDTARELPHSAFEPNRQTRYRAVDTPRLSSPYYAGSLNPDDVLDALNALRMVRYLAGLPYKGTAFTDELNNLSQHGATLLALYDSLSHEPEKPADMAQAFYDTAYLGCSNACLSSGYANISAAILGLAVDTGQSNINTAGHRRWLLRPGAADFGIGYAKGDDGLRYGGHRVSLYVLDGVAENEAEADTYIAWPSPGDFPIQYFIESQRIDITSSNRVLSPWSLNLGAAYQAPDKENITLTLTRSRGGVVVNTWQFDKTTPSLGDMPSGSMGMHFAANDSDAGIGAGAGIGKAITFRPDVASLGRILDGDVFTVRVDGLRSAEPGKAGMPAVLEYSIRFFDLAKEMKRSTLTFVVRQGDAPLPGAEIEVDGQLLETDPDGRASVRLGNNGNYKYTVEKEGAVLDAGMATVGAKSAEQAVDLPGVGVGLDPGLARAPSPGEAPALSEAPSSAQAEQSNAAVETGPAVLSDIDASYWAGSQISHLMSLGIVDGYPQANGTLVFDPGRLISRAEFMKLVAASMTLPLVESPAEAAFEDWSEVEEWARPYVATLVRTGIVKGADNDEGQLFINASACISREEMVAIAARAFGSQAASDRGVASTPDAIAWTIADFGDVQDWAQEDVLFVVGADLANMRDENGAPFFVSSLEAIEKGEANDFAPAEAARRDEAAAILSNMLARIDGVTH